MACGGSQTPRPQTSETVFSGHVRLAGSTPTLQVLIEPEDTSSMALLVTGDYWGELRRLSGAKVRVVGALAGGNRLRVDAYDIIEISGEQPLVGILEVSEARAYLRVAEGSGVEIHGAPSALLERTGAKVWVILDSNGAVIGYGVIREH